MQYPSKRHVHLALLLTMIVFVAVLLLYIPRLSAQPQQKPNILVIMGDDIGWYNTSIYNRGDMGYWTRYVVCTRGRGEVSIGTNHLGFVAWNR